MNCMSSAAKIIKLSGNVPHEIAEPLKAYMLEYLAFLWYTLSYIPYARTAVLKVFGMA